MININKILGNSVRSELIGNNISTISKYYNTDNYEFVKVDKTFDTRLLPYSNWEAPRFSLGGVFCCGHQTNQDNVISMEVYENDKKLEFLVVRNIWTPAYMDTYYRSLPDEYYIKSGLITIRERKCITKDDVFVSEITVFNDKRDYVALNFKIITNFEKTEYPYFNCNLKILPSALKKDLYLNGTFAIVSDNKYDFSRTISPFKKSSFKYSAAFDANNRNKANVKATKALDIEDVFTKNEKDFNKWFYENVPYFKCENTDLLKIYYYRWFLVYRNTFSPKKVIKDHYIDKTSVYECSYGTWYGCPVGLSVAMQIDDIKWMKSCKTAKDHLDNWNKKQGWYQGYIQYTPLAAWGFYELHPDKKWLLNNYDEFLNFTLSKLDLCDPEKLPQTEGSWVVGAEYQPNFYQYTTPAWDFWQDSEGIAKYNKKCTKLYRLDEIMFKIGSLYGCEMMAKELNKNSDYIKLNKFRKQMIDVVLKKFWNEKDCMFYDVDVLSDKQCDKAACYDSFAPFMWKMVDDKKYIKAVDKMLDENWFWGEFPITTVAKNCPMYWTDNCIAGPNDSSPQNPHYYNCSWNGTVWPFANSIAIEALGEVATEHSAYKKSWLEFFDKITQMHFLNGDKSVVDILEHYKVTDGTTFSNSNEYFHSSYINPFMKYWVGIGVEDKKVTFKPFTKEEFELNNVMINNKIYSFKQYLKDGKLKRELTENQLVV